MQVLCLNVKLCIFLAMLNLRPLQSSPYPTPHQDSGLQIIVEKIHPVYPLQEQEMEGGKLL